MAQRSRTSTARMRRSGSADTNGKSVPFSKASVRRCISADFETRITPCQFGGTPDCSNCGCIASAGLAAVARHQLFGFIPVGAIFNGSLKLGQRMKRLRPLETNA